MADKTNFTKEEWTLLLESPMIAGMAVTAADPSGLWGLLKETFCRRQCAHPGDCRSQHKRFSEGRSR
jgi:hypothetical protein